MSTDAKVQLGMSTVRLGTSKVQLVRMLKYG